MKCFRHPQAESVGTCKHCYKGVCTECAKDTGIGLVCSSECHEEVKSLKAIVDRSKQAFPLTARTHTRNAILLALFGTAFMAFGAITISDSFMFPFLLSFGAIMFIGAIFSFLMGRRFAKASRT